MSTGKTEKGKPKATSFEQLVTRLGVDGMARTDAQNKVPNPNAVDPTPNERSLIEYFREEVRSKRSEVKDTLDSYRKQMSEIYHSRVIEDLKGLPEELRRNNTDSRKKEEQDFMNLRDEAHKRETALHAFATANQLEREPQPQNNPMQVAFWISTIVLLETGLNATFFAVGSDRGLLGGAIQAFVISFLNVMAAWFLGRLCLPQLNHYKHDRRFLGGGCAALIVIGIVMLNLFAGHYRSALEADAFQAVIMAVKSFALDLFGIKSAQGWLLSAVGVVAFTALTTKIYFSDDPYPGYGKIYREYLQAHDDWHERQRAFTETIIANYNHVENKRTTATDSLTRLEVGYDVLLDKVSRLAEFYDSSLSQIENMCNKIVNRYRDKNKLFRSDKTAQFPGFFSRAVCLELDSFDLNLDLNEEITHQQELKRKFEDYRQNDSARIKAELEAIHNEEIESLDGFFGNV